MELFLHERSYVNNRLSRHMSVHVNSLIEESYQSRVYTVTFYIITTPILELGNTAGWWFRVGISWREGVGITYTLAPLLN